MPAGACSSRRPAVEPERFDPVVVLPVYNHAAGALATVARIRADGWPCVVVDDGSRAGDAALLDGLRADAAVTLLRLSPNQGKGAAVMAGLREAARQGRTHALQIDADGQHDAGEVGAFLAAAQAQPDAVICGVPRYDRSVPTGRRVGRWITHVWVWVHTLSFEIVDSMCGLRVYPLRETIAQLDEHAPGRRMDFDTDLLVRLHWRGVAVLNRPTPVTYPPGGVSHFRLWRDNWLISRMHTRLFFGMLWRLPRLLLRRAR